MLSINFKDLTSASKLAILSMYRFSLQKEHEAECAACSLLGPCHGHFWSAAGQLMIVSGQLFAK